MPHYDFSKDLAVSEVTEREVRKVLEDYYTAKGNSIVFIRYNKDNKYDLMFNINNEPTTFEVKEDFSCKRTGNVGLEYQCRGKASGIDVTQADYYVYKIHKKDSISFWLIPTCDLKTMVVTQQYFKKVIGGDKGSNSMNYLFKVDLFESFAINICPCNSVE